MLLLRPIITATEGRMDWAWPRHALGLPALTFVGGSYVDAPSTSLSSISGAAFQRILLIKECSGISKAEGACMSHESDGCTSSSFFQSLAVTSSFTDVQIGPIASMHFGIVSNCFAFFLSTPSCCCSTCWTNARFRLRRLWIGSFSASRHASRKIE